MRQQLLQRLTQIQNSSQFINQDIMTFTGFLDLEELVRYVENYESLM